MKEMKYHNAGNGERRLDALFSEYRSACPEPEANAQFMPQLWERIEAGRRVPTLLFQRWAKAFVLATAAGALFITTLVIPRYQRAPVYAAHYVDVLANADSKEDAVVVSEMALSQVTLDQVVASPVGDWE